MKATAGSQIGQDSSCRAKWKGHRTTIVHLCKIALERWFMNLHPPLQRSVGPARVAALSAGDRALPRRSEWNSSMLQGLRQAD